MNATIRPLTLQERQRPAQMSFYGGFRNVSFQIGIMEIPESSDSNLNSTTANIVRATIRKSSKIALPILVPRNMQVTKGYSNTVASVVGHKNNQSGFDAILVARNNERLSSFSTKLRTVESLLHTPEEQIQQQKEEEARLGRSSNARVHNQVMLTGIVVGASFEDGDTPRFHIQIRQDANPQNVIPLIYEGKNASALVSRMQYGGFISVTGEYAYRTVPVYQHDEDGKVVLDSNRRPMPVLDTKGTPTQRIHTYIRILPPKDPSEFDTNFGGSIPEWIRKFSNAMTEERNRRRTQHADATLRNSKASTDDDQVTTAPASISDI